MVGRNDPCPCGSGRKYKRCCAGKNEEYLDQQVTQELNRILFGVFQDASKKINFPEFESYAQNWKEELGKLWDMKSIEEAISAYYIFVARQDLWTGYLSEVLNSALRTKVRAVAETWIKPIVLLGRVKNEDEAFIEIEELFGSETYTLKKNEDMIGSADAIVYGMVFPDNSTRPNGIRVISSLMIIKDKMDSLKAAVRSFAESNKFEEKPNFFEAHMLEIYLMLLGKPLSAIDHVETEESVKPEPVESVEVQEVVEASEELVESDLTPIQEEVVEVSEELVESDSTPIQEEVVEVNEELVESDLTPIQQETVELLKSVLVERGTELKKYNFLESVCVSYFAKEQPNFRKANVVAAGVFRAALDLELLDEEDMTNGAVAKLFDISPASMTRHADAVRELIPEMATK